MGPPSLVEIPPDALTCAVAFGNTIAAGIVTSSTAAPPPPPPRMPMISSTLRPATTSATAEIVGAAADHVGASRNDEDPLHHRSNLTPPASLPQGSMKTPDAAQLFLPDPSIDAVFVPRLRQEFRSLADAYEFYKDYALLAGFSLRIRRSSAETAFWVCHREGHHKSKKVDVDKQTEKGSKWCGCGAYFKFKEDTKKQIWFFDHVQLTHNHKLEPSPRITKYLHIHKNIEEGMGDIFNIMIANEVTHQPALHVMAHLYGDRQKWGFTEKDIENKKSEYSRLEKDDDLNKLPGDFYGMQNK
ncbi:unnamed protein product [Urochloa humidicola]